METSSIINLMARPEFYTKIYINGPYEEAGNTRCIVDLLLRKPDILPLIHYLVLDEYDEGSYRQLLAFDMPNLRSIILQQGGYSTQRLDAETKKALNAHILAKPQLTNFSFRICLDGARMFHIPDAFKSRYEVTLEDIPLFYHPSITRLRIDFADLSVLGAPSVEPFPYENLELLDIEFSSYSPEVLRNILANTRSLKTIELKNNGERPTIDPQVLPQLLQTCQHSLKVLKLWWTRWSDVYKNGIFFSNFTALKFLLIPPKALFGPYDDDTDFVRVIKERVPPNLKILYLDGLTTDPAAPPREDGEETLSVVDHKLLQTVMNNLALLPYLRYLVWTGQGRIAEPRDLDILADQVGIVCSGVRDGYDMNPNIEWLDTIDSPEDIQKRAVLRERLYRDD
ncbi:hypothetical protein FSARC_11854 [Fusarium sarcochroum]|uniref:F-box domain-containing protein n=1 Tax=Fusarium sarcochroum TaxID=1208366 RepID=A0A8H4TD36_9HYPO|nr:hypothetical protein FSARC_11854 [Fusarium sarcochroum]